MGSTSYNSFCKILSLTAFRSFAWSFWTRSHFAAGSASSCSLFFVFLIYQKEQVFHKSCKDISCSDFCITSCSLSQVFSYQLHSRNVRLITNFPRKDKKIFSLCWPPGRAIVPLIQYPSRGRWGKVSKSSYTRNHPPPTEGTVLFSIIADFGSENSNMQWLE